MENLSELSDDALLSGLESLIGSQRQLLAGLLRYLVEVEERRLHLQLAYGSMFEFCTAKLRMSEGEAFRRIADKDSLLMATVAVPFEDMGRFAVDAVERIAVKKEPKDAVVKGPYTTHGYYDAAELWSVTE